MAIFRTYKNEFMRYMSREGLKYQEKGAHVVKVGYKMDNLTVELFVHFDEDGDNYVSIHSYNIGSFSGNNQAKAIYICNEMNKRYKWVRFYMDDDSDVIADADAIVDMNSVGASLVELCMRMVTVIDEAYPVFMKIRWS